MGNKNASLARTLHDLITAREMSMRFVFALGILFLFGCPALNNAPNIVIVGDSLSCGSFGENFLQDLSDQGNQVTVYCAISSAPQHWLTATNPKNQICQTMNTANPTLEPCGGDGKMISFASILAASGKAQIIIALGTNSLMSTTADASYSAMAQAIQANGNACEWIGPPHLRPDESIGFPPGRLAIEEQNLAGFYTSLQSAVSPCSFVDSRDATAPGTPGSETLDGVHRTEDAGEYWADILTNTEIDGE
jgi:hypothetical protein